MQSNTRIVSFETLLISMVLLLIVPTLVSAEWLTPISRLHYTFTMIASLYLVSADRNELIVGIILFIPAMTTKWMLAPASADQQLLAYCVFQTVFLGYVMRTVYRYLMNARRIDSEIIYASVVLYLMFGLTLSLVYYAILVVVPEAFGGKILLDLTDQDSATAVLHELLYFSFVTQTTLGYGDISPTLPVARTIALFQAIMGQLYLAVVIARLVGIHIANVTVEEKK